jgi:hypothetical protein
MSDLTDCPHRPGTPEWKQWQAEWVEAESWLRRTHVPDPHGPGVAAVVRGPSERQPQAQRRPDRDDVQPDDPRLPEVGRDADRWNADWRGLRAVMTSFQGMFVPNVMTYWVVIVLVGSALSVVVAGWPRKRAKSERRDRESAEQGENDPLDRCLANLERVKRDGYYHG